MSAKPATTEKNEVTLIQQGVGRQEYTLPEGATLAELLQKAQAQAEGQSIYIDGKPLEEQFTLQPGMIVTVVTPKKNAALDEPLARYDWYVSRRSGIPRAGGSHRGIARG